MYKRARNAKYPNLENYIKERNLSNHEFAKLLNIPASTLSNIRNGRCNNRYRVNYIANFANIPEDVLFEEVEENVVEEVIEEPEERFYEPPTDAEEVQECVTTAMNKCIAFLVSYGLDKTEACILLQEQLFNIRYEEKLSMVTEKLNQNIKKDTIGS